MNVKVDSDVKDILEYTIDKLQKGRLYKIVFCNNSDYHGRYVFKPLTSSDDAGLLSDEAIVIARDKADYFSFNLYAMSFNDTDKFVETEDVLNITLSN